MKIIYFIAFMLMLSCSSQHYMKLNSEELIKRDNNIFSDNKYLVLDYSFEDNGKEDYYKIPFDLNTFILNSKKLKNDYKIIPISVIEKNIKDCKDTACKLKVLDKYKYHTSLHLNVCVDNSQVLVSSEIKFRNYYHYDEFNFSKTSFNAEESAQEISEKIVEYMEQKTLIDEPTEIPSWLKEDDYIIKKDGKILFKIKGVSDFLCNSQFSYQNAGNDALRKVMGFFKSDIEMKVGKYSFELSSMSKGKISKGKSSDIPQGDYKDTFIDNNGRVHILYTNVKEDF